MNYHYINNGASLALDIQKCTGCGLCADVCPHGVFDMERGRARIADRGLCMECGACALNCAFSAITVDSGVGCAGAVISGLFTGKEPECGCSQSDKPDLEKEKKQGGCCCG